jgi:hypothetical protein
LIKPTKHPLKKHIRRSKRFINNFHHYLLINQRVNNKIHFQVFNFHVDFKLTFSNKSNAFLISKMKNIGPKFIEEHFLSDRIHKTGQRFQVIKMKMLKSKLNFRNNKKN